MTTTTTKSPTIDAAAQASIGAAARELHLPTVRTEAARLAEIAARERQTLLAYLAEVLAAEVDDRTERRRARRISAPLAVQVGLAFDRGRIDSQRPAGGAAQVAAQPWLGLQRPDELVAAPLGPTIGADDQALEVSDEPVADRHVPLGLSGVVADHEPLRPGPVITVVQATGFARSAH